MVVSNIGNNKIGELDAREFKAAMRAMEFEVHKADIKNLFAEVNKDTKQGITFEEFVKIVVPKLPDKDSKEEIRKIFNLFCEDKAEKIDIRSLKKIVQEVGENISEDELNDMFQEADRDKDGFIGFDDFYRVMKRGNADPLDDWDDEI